MRALLISVICTLSVAFTINNCSAEVAVGDKMPSFQLVGSDGVTYDSEKLLGKTAYVIAWFPKAFTGGCTKECKSMREFGDSLRRFDVTYFTASVDPVEKNTAFSKSLDLDYPILSDPGRKLSQKLGCHNPRGVTNRWTYYVGVDGKILHIDRSVKTATHGKDIAAKLEQLGVAKP